MTPNFKFPADEDSESDNEKSPITPAAKDISVSETDISFHRRSKEVLTLFRPRRLPMRSQSSMSRSQNGASPQGRGVIRTSSNCDTPYLCISITLQQPQSGILSAHIVKSYIKHSKITLQPHSFTRHAIFTLLHYLTVLPANTPSLFLPSSILQTSIGLA